MAKAIKYQQQIHKAFANELAKYAPSSENFYSELQKKILAEHPEAAAMISIPKGAKKQLPPELAAIAKSNEDICKYFYLSTDAPFADKGEDGEYSSVFSSAETVAMYANTLDSARMLLEEESDEGFKKVHKRVVDTLETYFSLVAEEVLFEYYGNDYTRFVKKFTKDEEKRQAEQYKKRQATIAAKK